MNAARSIAENFNELSKEIEVFPQKVATALRVQAQDAGILGDVWSAVKKFATFFLSTCMSISDTHITISSGCVRVSVGLVLSGRFR